MNPRETIGSVVSHDLIDSAFKNGRNRAARTMMHPVTQLEIAERKFRVDHVVIERIEFGLVET